MASKHVNLPIYKKTYELAHLVAEITRSMRREYKSTIGSQMQNESLLMVVDVYRAAAGGNRADVLTGLLERLEVVTLIWQLCADLRLISLAQHARALPLLAEIGRQAGGWRKSTNQALPPRREPRP